jgi:hypothetical protein
LELIFCSLDVAVCIQKSTLAGFSVGSFVGTVMKSCDLNIKFLEVPSLRGASACGGETSVADRNTSTR